MTIDEAFISIKEQRPQLVHVSGKTSTGKSTFGARLNRELGYEIVELDKIVAESVVGPLNLADRGQVFLEVYKHRNRLDWIKRFVDAARQNIRQHLQNGHRIVVDGAVAHPETLQEILAPFPGAEIIYFHPADLETYQDYLTQRFLQADIGFEAGLPVAFWELVDRPEFQKFCKDRVVTSGLHNAISRYAVLSQESSVKRLKDLRTHFADIKVVHT